METKIRNGEIFNLEKSFDNDNYTSFRADYFDWGLGANFYIGDSRRYFKIDLLCFHLDIWF